jgi:PIN domain nuclease of toxin-antitoxin system
MSPEGYLCESGVNGCVLNAGGGFLRRCLADFLHQFNQSADVYRSVILLDTHVLVWLDEASPRLGSDAIVRIDAAFQADNIAVSAISFWEVAMLVRKGRIRLDMDLSIWRNDLLEQGIIELPVTGEIGIKAAGLESFHGDPADRLIAATALLCRRGPMRD